MAFSENTITQPARGSEARKIAKAIRSGKGIKGPAHEQLVKRLRELREHQAQAKRKVGNGDASKKSVGNTSIPKKFSKSLDFPKFLPYISICCYGHPFDKLRAGSMSITNYEFQITNYEV
jgi:hypothetical protein